jgi:ubiquitin-like modifier-activating enzyme ATG7
LLSSFVIVSFFDLKKFKFHYWFAFPAIHSEPQWAPILSKHQGQDIENLRGTPLSLREGTELVDAVQTWSSLVDHRQRGFFLARKRTQSFGEVSLDDDETKNTQQNMSVSNWQIATLSEYENGFFEHVAAGDRYICFSDPSNYDLAPGWMLRNLLILVKQRWGLERVQILRYRDVHARRDQGRSTVIQLESVSKDERPPPKSLQNQGSLSLPKVTGWERNPNGKLSGRIVNLTEYMDPRRYASSWSTQSYHLKNEADKTQRLADQSVDLNLKLIKWRISPTLDLEKIKHSKCLLLGAGTLGSYVSRNLLVCGPQHPVPNHPKLKVFYFNHRSLGLGCQEDYVCRQWNRLIL